MTAISLKSKAMKKIYYCYDAYCGWCYGFSKGMTRLADTYQDRLSFEVLSGGMVLPEKPVHISATASYVAAAYPRVEEMTGVEIGEGYLWHIQNPQESDWFPHSEKPAIALCILKEFMPQNQVRLAADLQYALHFEGRDLTDDEAYRHLLEKYGIDEADFYTKLHSDAYKEKAYYEFALCKQLQVSGYPAVYIAVSDTKLYQVARGYTSFEDLKQRVDKVLQEHQEN